VNAGKGGENRYGANQAEPPAGAVLLEGPWPMGFQDRHQGSVPTDFQGLHCMLHPVHTVGLGRPEWEGWRMQGHMLQKRLDEQR
jgi:hypothetical protein